MDWQLVIAINVMIISFIALVFGHINRRSSDPWMIAVHALILVVAGVALDLGSANAGTYALGLFVVLAAAPGLLVHYANRAYLQARYADAARFAAWGARLHPSPSMTFNAAVMGALAADDAGESVAMLEALLVRATPPQAAQLEATAARLKGDWAGVLAIARDETRDTRALKDLEIRALGELGNTDEMIAVYEASKAHLAPASLRFAQMVVLAYSGRPDAIALLRTDDSMQLNAEFISFWEAIAVFNAPGRRGEGRAMLERVAETSTIRTNREAALRYLAGPGGKPPNPPSPQAAVAVEQVVKRWYEAGTMRAAKLARSPFTVALIIANSLMFAAEHTVGGVEDAGTLVLLGALWPPLVTQNGEWWRLVTALFLHYGVAHFAINMASLSILGRMVETAFGSRRMLAIYALGGLGSMATVFAAMASGMSEADFVVGASGAVMALFGAWAARILRRYAQSRDVLDRQPVILMGLIVLIQCAVDLSVPQISFTAHISGFLIGFVLGLMLSREDAGRSPAG